MSKQHTMPCAWSVGLFNGSAAAVLMLEQGSAHSAAQERGQTYLNKGELAELQSYPHLYSQGCTRCLAEAYDAVHRVLTSSRKLSILRPPVSTYSHRGRP